MSADRPSAPAIDPDHPWIGLDYYIEEMRGYFFGRTAETQELYRRVRANVLTVLFGQSGLGKSSLLRAGLFPLIRLDWVVPVEVRLNFRHPSLSLTEQVREALRRALPGQAPEGAETLWEDLHAPVPDSAGARPVPLFVFDQFEELFTLGREAEPRLGVDAFVSEIAAVVQNHAPDSLEARLANDPDLVERYDFSRADYRVLISLREDYLAEFETLKTNLPAIMENRVALKHLSRSAALEAILGPGRIRPETPLVEAATAESIVDFLTQAAAADPVRVARRSRFFSERVEPAFLSLVCSELNDRRPAGGQIDATLLSRNRDEILNGFYERSLADQSSAVRVFIEDELVTESGYRESVSEDRAVATLRDSRVDDTALSTLVDRRLLRVEDRLDARRVELTHDILTGVVQRSGEARRRRQRIRRNFALAGGAVLLIALIAGGVVWNSRRQAKEQAQKLEQAEHDRKHEAEVSRRFAQQSSQSDFLLASLYARDDPRRALAYLSRALKSDPENHAAETLGWSLSLSIPFSIAVFQHEESVNSASFSPDGTRVITASGDHTARVWDARSGWPLTEPLKHKDYVESASFSPDGTRVVTASGDHTARVWDAHSGQPLTEPLKHEDYVNSASFSPDGTRVVTASWDETARVWDARSGRLLTEPLKHEHGVNSASFSPDGTRVVTASWDNTARVWDARSGQPLTEPLEHKGHVNSASFSPDGTRVVTASWDKTARVWDARSGQPLTEPLKHKDYVESASFSPDGARVVTASLDNTARVWDARSGQPLTEPLKHDALVRSASFSSDGTRVVTASSDNTARVWDARSGQPLTEPLKHEYLVRSASFSPDGTRVVTASWDETARVWDARSGQPLIEPLKHEQELRSASFSPDGTRIVTASWDNTARVWDARSGQPLTEPLKHEYLVRSASFSPDGTRVVTASWDNTARVWDARSGQPLTKPLKHEGPVWSASFSPDGTRVVTASWDNTARVWDARSGQPLTEPLKHEGYVNSASFSPDGTRVVTASWDKTVRVWDARSGQPLTKPLKHEQEVNSASFSSDGTRVVTASRDGTARVWDARSGQPLTKPLKHEQEVNSASFSSDGTRVVTASSDKTARVWDARSGQLSEPLQHDDRVLSASFSADGTRVVTASSDDTARVWDARSGQLLTEPLKHEGWVNSASFSPDGTRVVTASRDKTARVWDIASDQSSAPPWVSSLFDQIAGQHLGDEASFPARITAAIRQPSVSDSRETRAVFAKWLVADRDTRPISPLSSETISQYIDRRLKIGSEEAINEAFIANPVDPLVLIAKAGLEEDSVRADFLRRYAVEHFGEQSATTWERAAEMLQEQEQLELALMCAENAIKLDPSLAPAHYRKSSVLWAQKRKDESIATFVRLFALEPRCADASFISQLGVTEKQVAALQQIRAAAVAAHPELAPQPEPSSDGAQPLQ